MRTLSNCTNLAFLHLVRDSLGDLYGSEDLAILLYSLVKRERPRVFVELGTGQGVTTLWVAAAMKENGFGTIFTVDNGAHFEGAVAKFKDRFDACVETQDQLSSHPRFISHLCDKADVADHVRYIHRDIDLTNIDWLTDEIRAATGETADPTLDMVFSDYDHSANTIAALVANFLPRLSPVGSLFIDSASTKVISYLLLEKIEQMFVAGKTPHQILACLVTEAERQRLIETVRNATIRLTHLVENKDRAQNSTAWLRVERASLVPELAKSLR